MQPLMYRQRPAYPALILATCVLVIGLLSVLAMGPAVDAGEMDASAIFLVVCLSLCISGACVIAAFARYQFSHLWKNPDPAFSKKARQKRDNGRP